MAGQGEEYWRKKLVVKNIPEDWSYDLIKNFLEVVTDVDVVEEGGFEYFGDITHTALVSFVEPLTNECITEAQQLTTRKGKPLVLTQIKEGPSSILVSDLDPNLTQDNLFYYFDSPRSGGSEGEVEDDGCQLYQELGFAVVTFTSPAVVADILAVEEHRPSRGTKVQVEPCYKEFHIPLINQMKHHSQSSPSLRMPSSGEKESGHHVRHSQSEPVISRNQQKAQSRDCSQKVEAKIKPALLPIPASVPRASVYPHEYPDYEEDAENYESEQQHQQNQAYFPHPSRQPARADGRGAGRVWRGKQSSIPQFTLFPPRRPSGSDEQDETGCQNYQSCPRGKGRNRRRSPRRGNNRGKRGNYGYSQGQQNYGNGAQFDLPRDFGPPQPYRDGSPHHYGGSQAYRDGSPQRTRGRGRGGRQKYPPVSRPWEAEEQFSYSEGYKGYDLYTPQHQPVRQRQGYEGHDLYTPQRQPVKQRQVIRLDEDCNPILPDPMSVDDDGDSLQCNVSDFQYETLYDELPEFGYQKTQHQRKGTANIQPSPVPPKPKKTASDRNMIMDKQHHLSADSAEDTFYSDEDNFTSPAKPAFATKPTNNPLNNSNVSTEAENTARRAAALEAAQKRQMEEELQKLRMEKEKLQSEKEKLLLETEEKLKQQQLKTERLLVPPYKLRLLKQLASDCQICQITLLEKEILLHGTEDNCRNVKCEILMKIQDLAEDSRSIPPAIVSVLETKQGQRYLDQLHKAYPNCSLDMQDSSIVCAAHDISDVKKFFSEWERNVRQEVCKVPSTVSLSPSLLDLKTKLEREFMVHLTLPRVGQNKIGIDGINGDVDMALRELHDFMKTNQPGRENYKIPGALAERALKEWYSQELDDAKGLILKNGGEVTQQVSDASGVTLVYQCREDVLGEVKTKLGKIAQQIACASVNLHATFTSYSERALVISGLHINGVDAFCVTVQQKVKQQKGIDCILAISLPPKCSLPKMRYDVQPKATKRPSSSKPSPRPAPLAKPQVHHSDQNQFHTYTAKVGNTSIVVKTGDISKENAQVLVSIIGEDLDMKGTAVGSSIMKRFPQAAQDLQNHPTGGGCQVISGQSARGLQAVVRQAAGLYVSGDPLILHAVLKKLSEPALTATVKQLTQQCLALASQSGKTSIAFPPLGVGRKFQYPDKTVANAMVGILVNFLQGRGAASLQTATFVIYDFEVAKKFKIALMNAVPSPPRPSRPVVRSRSIEDLRMRRRHFAPRQQRTVDDAYDDLADSGAAFDDDDDDDYGDDMGFQAFASPFAGIPVNFGDDGNDNDNVDNGGSSSGSDDEGLSFVNLPDDGPQDSDLTQFVAQMPAASPTPSKLEAQICAQNQGSLRAVQDLLVKELKSTFLNLDTIHDIKTFKKLGSKAMDEIQALALKESVVIRVADTGKDGKVTVCGQKAGVAQVVLCIKDKISRYLNQERKDSRSSHRHKVTGLKDTRDIPSYWKIAKGGVIRTFQEAVRKMMKHGNLHSVDGEEQKAIEKLIQDTWMPQFIGHGKDGVGLNHRNIKVVKVQRLENPHLWEGYCTYREGLIIRLESSKQTSLTPVAKLPGSSGPIRTTSSLSKGSPLCRKIYPLEINEHYLFHGTQCMQKILDEGLDGRISSENAMLGRGVYAAESATKADQYADDKRNRTGGNKTMILVRMLLGQPFVSKNGNPPKYSRPPCMRCSQDKCNPKCSGGMRYDSVIDDAGRNFREFVVYERQQCYPEYFITYVRV